MSFYDNLMKVMNEKKLRQVDITRDLGFTSANFYQWKKGSAPRNEALKKLAEYLGVSPSFLLGFTDESKNDISMSDAYEIGSARLIPLFNGIPDSDNIFDELKYINGNVYCSDNLKAVPDLFATIVTSNTMSPILDAGDLVIAQQTDKYKMGDMILYRLFGETGVRWYSENETDILLIPENKHNQSSNPQGYRQITISKEKIDEYDFEVIGKVVETRKYQRNLYNSAVSQSV